MIDILLFFHHVIYFSQIDFLSLNFFEKIFLLTCIFSISVLIPYLYIHPNKILINYQRQSQPKQVLVGQHISAQSKSIPFAKILGM